MPQQKKPLPPIEADRRRMAYGAAERALRSRHRDEFEQLYEKACAEHNVPYKRKLTPAEKEAQTVREILARRPDLHDMVGELINDIQEAKEV